MKAPTYPQNHEEVTPKTELAQSIYTRLTDWEKKTGRKIEKSVIDCITSLPEGGNTVIDAQLSSDFGECLMLYVNVILARGDNLLVLCRDEETCVHIREYIDSVLSRINGLAPIWMVRSVEDAYQSSDCDVLVVTPDAIMNETVRNAQKRFFDRLNMVLMVDISNLIAEMGMLMIAATRFLETGREKELQYIALSNGIPNELRATLEQSFSPGRPFRAFECFSSNSLTRIMLWNYEPAGEGKVRTAQSNLFGSSVDQVYLGVALPLALLAVKNGVKDISIMGNHIPSKQLIDSLRLF